MSVDLKQLKHAITLSEKIEALEAELREILGGSVLSGTPAKRRGRPAKASASEMQVEVPRKRKRRKLSAKALEAIREGQRRRWAKVRKAKKD